LHPAAAVLLKYLAHLHAPESDAKAAKRGEWVWCSREVLR
jgi:hypothetical protein